MARPQILLGPVDGLTAAELNNQFLTIVAAEEWGTMPTLGEGDFARLVDILDNSPRLFTFVDLFCGAGGSSVGLVMAGGKLLFAANHSKRNIATHSANHPNAEHRAADLNHYDMRNIPAGADVLWASPICTEVSPSGGGSGANKKAKDELRKYGTVSEDEFIRTRATFHDVIRATEVHGFKYIVVENVVEAAWKWRLFGWWLDGMQIAHDLGYDYQIVSVSAAHIGDHLNPHAPQRRDRMYIVFNRRDCPKPELQPRPVAQCDTCGIVEGVQHFKKDKGTLTKSGRYFKVGKYGIKNGQYVYICPNIGAHKDQKGLPIVIPLERPAAAVIDWTDLGVPIGEREQHGLDPLVPNTIARIRRGMLMFAQPIHLNHAGNTFERPGYTRAWPAADTPFMTQQATNTTALAWPPFLDATGGQWNTDPTSTDQPFRTRMANPKGYEALVCPPFLAKNYNGNPDDMVKPIDEAFGTVTTWPNHSVVVPQPFITNSAHDNDRFYGIDEALPTATTKTGYGVVTPPFLVQNNSDGGRPQDRVAPTDQAFATVTTGRNQSLVVPPGAFIDTMRNHGQATGPYESITTLHASGNAHSLVVPYHRTGVATNAASTPMPTMTTVDRAGLASGFDDPRTMFDVNLARYRTLRWFEQARAQRFPRSYQWTGNNGERTAGAGNAVASNVACWIGRAIAAALNRTAARA